MLQVGNEKLKFSTPNKSFIKGLTNFALAGCLYASELIKANGVNSVPIYLNGGNEIQF